MLKVIKCNGYDLDGVVLISDAVKGVYPGLGDVIITGRSIEERPETERALMARSIFNVVYYQQAPFAEKTRVGSGRHKAAVINRLNEEGRQVVAFFEDDEVQAAEIRRLCPTVEVIMVVHGLTPKENVRHHNPEVKP